VRASSSIWRTCRASSCRIRSSERSSRCCFGLGDRHPRQTLELTHLALLRVLQLGVKRLGRLLAVGEALLAAGKLDHPTFELLVRV
jgi:hypothetical protein